MNTKKILIAGGTGFVGKNLIAFLAQQGYILHVLTRKANLTLSPNIKFFRWDTDQNYIDSLAFEGVDTIINLTGANIGEKKWTKQRKKEIVNSRIKSINLLYRYVSENHIGINTFISSSAVGYYGAKTSDTLLTETSENGTDFLASVCQLWEEAAARFNNLGVRTVILRKGVILGKDGGIVQKLTPLGRWSINTALGSGKQHLPWIDLHDLLKLYAYLLSNPKINGIYNAVASDKITMNDFSKALLQSLGKSSVFPNVPAFVIRFILGEMAIMLLEGSPVSNQKLKNNGFSFESDTIDVALLKMMKRE